MKTATATPTRPIRVLVVDDSAVVRKMVTDALSADPEIEVVGTALDPYIAKDKILALQPDVLTLDLEMPRMDGLTFLKILMERRPMPVVIMSSLTQPGSAKALEALQFGAIDVLGKPGTAYSIGDLGPQLVAKVKAAAQARVRRRPSVVAALPPEPPPAPVARAPANREDRGALAPSRLEPAAVQLAGRRPLHPPPRSGLVRLVAPGAVSAHTRKLVLIGASTGGTEAIRAVLERLPAEVPPIAIVQHIPAMFSRAFADRLNTICAMEVREAAEGDELRPGLALVAPGNFHLLLQHGTGRYRARISDGPMVWHQRPAVDLLFKSAVDAAAPHTVAVLLTGMGRDGAEGMLALRQRGARTIAQDEESSVVYGMPRVAAELGAAEQIVPLERVAESILAALATVPD
jgi:two-component system chemotaxis response regulator CheB